MKRSELVKGMEVVDKQGFRGTVEDTEPWVQPREYMGRFGYHNSGNPHPWTERDKLGGYNRSGVVVKRSSGSNIEVWQLSQIEPAADYDARAAAKKSEVDRENEKMAELIKELESWGIASEREYRVPIGSGRGHYTTRVIVYPEQVLSALKEAL